VSADNTPVAGYAPSDKAGTSSVVLPARPEALKINPAETAVIVVDMQNAYASKGGYVDLAGFDVLGAAAAIEQTRKVLDAAVSRLHGYLLPERLGQRLCGGRRPRFA
jgi:hypothetical protein